MSDNLTTQSATPATVPASSVIATDDVSGVHFQKVKIDVGGDGASATLGNSNPLPVSDAGSTLSIDDGGGNISIDDGGNTITVDGTVSVTGVATLAEQQTQTTALQLIDDTVYTDGTGTPSKAIGVAGTDGTNPQIIKTDASGELQVDVLTMPTVAVTQSGTWDEVGINDSGNSITVDNGGTFATQVTSISAGDNNIGNVDLASAIPAGDNAIGRVKLTDGTDVADVLDLTNANPLTVAIVDGSGDQITSFGSGTQYTEGDADATITGTAVMWEDGSNVLRAASAAKPLPVEIIAGGGTGGTSAADDADFTDGTTAGTPAMGVYEGTPSTVTDGDLGVVGITEDRQLKVSVGNTVTVASHAVTNAGTFAVQVDGNALTSLQLIDDAVFVDDADWTDNTSKHINIGGVYQSSPHTVTDGDVSPALMDANGRLIVAATDNGGSLTVDNGGTFAVQVSSISAGDNNIGNVDLASSIPAGTNNIGDVDILTIAAGDNNIGNVDIVSLPALAAGTNAIGKLLPPDTDVTGHTNYAKKYYTNAGSVTDGIVWSPAAGKRWHVVSMFINVSAAATVTFEDDKAGGDEVVMKMELAANSGMTINYGEQYPLASGEDAADLLVTTTAGNIYITVTGYEI